ncbi:MAG: glutaredoxin domain-containing protein [Ornithinibacter sp.]
MGLIDVVAGRPARGTYADVVAGDGSGVVVYWRPGCPFCSRLRFAVRKDRDRITWVNIWEDDDARLFVASLNGGNETVPTVVIDGVPHTNPDPSVVTGALRPS